MIRAFFIAILIHLVYPVFSGCHYSYNLAIENDSAKIQLSPLPFPDVWNPNIFCSWEITVPSNVVSLQIDCNRFHTQCISNYFGLERHQYIYCGNHGSQLSLKNLTVDSNDPVLRAYYISNQGIYGDLDCDVWVSSYYAEEVASSSTTVSTTSSSTTTEDPQEEECQCGYRQEASRIVNGEETGIHEYPWQVALLVGNQHFCGGTLINKEYILTAAHCAEYSNNILVRVGEHNLTSNSDTDKTIDITVSEIIIHENYDVTSVPDNDIALLKLSSPVSFNDAIHPVCLPFNFEIKTPEQSAKVTGWGKTNYYGSTSDYLQEVDLTIREDSYCSSAYAGAFNPDTMLCTYDDGKDSCQGDSGGPLVVEDNGKYIVVGVVSWGEGCAFTNRPGVYTEVTKYLESKWIEKTIGSTAYQALCGYNSN